MSKSLTAQFTDWVATKNPHEAYDFFHGGECAFAQFEKDIGSWHGVRTILDYGDGPVFPDGLAEKLRALPWTFGSLAARLAESPR